MSGDMTIIDKSDLKQITNGWLQSVLVANSLSKDQKSFKFQKLIGCYSWLQSQPHGKITPQEVYTRLIQKKIKSNRW